NQILQETARYLNTTILNYQETDAVAKLQRFYDMTEAYYKVNLPEYYPIKKAFIDKYRTW
ncbi:MAG: hypothetical protein V1913_16320, partial [Fibrobacterota bacterium]